MKLIALIVLAIICESLWEIIKLMIPKKFKVPVWLSRIMSFIIAIVLIFGTKIDIMVMLDLPMDIPYSGFIITALLISKGSNWVHDLLKKIAAAYTIKDIYPELIPRAPAEIKPTAVYDFSRPLEHPNKIINEAQQEATVTLDEMKAYERPRSDILDPRD